MAHARSPAPPVCAAAEPPGIPPPTPPPQFCGRTRTFADKIVALCEDPRWDPDWFLERNGQIDAPTEIVGPTAAQPTAPDPFAGAPAALSERLERLQHRTDALEQELASERERRAGLETALDRQRDESGRLHAECARLRTELEQGDHHMPPPAWADRPVNPALRTKWRWILRVLALLVMLVVLGAVYLVIHAYVTHESIQHVWSQVRSPF